MEPINAGRVHISVHIEGTTNSSFVTELGAIYGPEHVLVYQLASKRFFRLSDLPQTSTANLIKFGKDFLEKTPLLNQLLPGNGSAAISSGEGFTRSELPSDTAVVHGYFTPTLFKGIFENPFISIILKDPLDRMITLYKEWNQKNGEVDWRVKIPYQNTMSFQEFALQEELINSQSKSLGNRRLGDYDLVGVAECQAGFVAQLKNKDWTNYLTNESSGYKLKKPPYKPLGITEEFLDEFRTANQMDYAIYQQAKEFMGF